MPKHTDTKKVFHLQYPIIQAPMAGGATTPELIAAVCRCGGLGSLGAGYLDYDAIKFAIKRIRQQTNKVFAVNLFSPERSYASAEALQMACEAVNQCSPEMGRVTQLIAPPYAPSFDDQVAAVLEEKVPVVSFTFGLPGLEIIRALQSNSSVVLATATTVEEALLLQEYQVDAIVLQGSEAGGHRGSFMPSADVSLSPIASLLQNTRTKVQLPLIASGGVMRGATIAQLLDLGASAVQLGTAFLCCKESGIAQSYKDALLNQSHDSTVLTRAFSGKLARGISNTFIQRMRAHEQHILDYPIQNKLTNPLRTSAKQCNNTEFMSLWAGQGVALSRDLDVHSLFTLLIEEMNVQQ